MTTTNYQSWEKTDLINEIHRLRKRKKYGLVWEDKPENVVEQCKTELPVLEEVKDKEIITDPDKPVNLLIEGDNYHALSVLNYTHRGKVDVIYIDPPYNTGAKDWKYNNDYVDGEDPYKNTKWISMMHKRLKQSKILLKKNGVLVAMIDNYEVHNLRHILEEIFLDKDIVITVIEHNHRGRAKSNFALTHEYAIWVLPKNIESITRKKEFSNDTVLNLRRTGQNSLREDRPTMFYGIIIDKNDKIIGVTNTLKDKNNAGSITVDKNHRIILPIDKQGTERRWYYGAERLINEKNSGNVFAKTQRGRTEIYFKFSGKPVRRKSVWIDPKYDSSSHGTGLLNKILGKDVFSFPKSIWAVKECIESATNDQNALILDFFAGSGTTGHAVLELNKQDGGNRKFILCTNNELNGKEKELREKGLSEKEIQSHGICQAVTYPRIKKVIQGYHNGKSEVNGLGGNLKYYQTSFVPAGPTDQNKIALTKKATAMLCVKEDTFEEVKTTEQYKIFRNKKRYTGVVFDYQAIDDFKKEIAKIDGKFSLYIFSLGDDTFDEEFEDIKKKVKLSPIPETILKVYREIFKLNSK